MDVEKSEKTPESKRPDVANPNRRTVARVWLPKSVAMVQTGKLIGVDVVTGHDTDTIA